MITGATDFQFFSGISVFVNSTGADFSRCDARRQKIQDGFRLLRGNSGVRRSVLLLIDTTID